MTDPGADSENVAREAFLAAYKADLVAGRIRTLAEYQDQFPGHEESIADEWRWLEPATVDVGREATAGHPPAQRQIGPYRIIEELGHGAQATVYLAEHETLRRQVALKVLRATVMDETSTSEQRFRREAEVTASIEHPNICSVYEAGCSDGVTWIAMQYVPGSTLATCLARHREGAEKGAKGATLHLPASDASSEVGSKTPSSGAGKRSDLMRVVTFAEQAARALHVAHEHGLVHRDIKPGNLIVADDDGRPVILDFGLAHTDESMGGLALTRSHEVLGTPYYMAPEQLRAGTDGVDRRTDVYALGVTLFECLTGRRPFDAVSVEALYRQILTVEPPAPRTLNPHIPRDLEVVLQTAIEKEPGRRYQTATDFAEDLRRVRQYEPIRAKPVSTWGRVVRLARRHPAVTASLSIAVVSLVVGLVVSLWFLQAANQALGERNKALANWYETVSLRSASDNMRTDGKITLMQQKLRDRALAEIRRENARFEFELARTLQQVRGGPAGNHTKQLVDVMEKAAALSRTGQHAAADLLTPELRNQLDIVQLDPSPERQELAATLAEEHLKLLEDLPGTDDRRIRARILLLDCLIQNNRPSDAKKRLDAWRQADSEASLREDPARDALYESRRGAVLLGIGEAEEARKFLTHAVPKVREAFPHSWYSNTAQAYLVAALDATGQLGEAAKARRELGKSLRNSLGHRILAHSTAYAQRTVFGKAHAQQWDRLTRLFWTSFSGHIDGLDDLLTDLERSKKPGESDIDEVAATFYLYLIPELANSLGLGNADFSRNDVGRLTQDAAEFCKALPLSACHYSHRVRAYVGYARHLAACGNYEKARYWAELARRGLPVRDQWSAEWVLGSYLAQLGEYEEAEKLLSRALPEAESWYDLSAHPAMETLHGLARLHRLKGNLAEALVWHEKSIERRPRSSFERRFRAITWLQFGRLDEADKAFDEALDVAPKDLHAGWRKAQVLLLRGDHDGAIRRAEEARALAQEVEKESNEVFEAAMRSKQTTEAGKARRRASWAGFAMRRADGIQAMALFARGKPGDTEAALPYFKSAATGPDRVDGDGFWSDYGKALVASGDKDGALVELEKLTTRRSGDPLAWHARARFLATTDGYREEAVKWAQKASELCNRNRAFVLAMLAEAQFRAGEPESASETATKVKTLMDGRDAQWLSVKQAEARFAR
ncbi:MAG: protein kinase domain-containing protein [Planctomycetota bacterium]